MKYKVCSSSVIATKAVGCHVGVKQAFGYLQREIKLFVRSLGMLSLARSGFDDLGLIAGFSDEELLEQTQIRSEFPETWLFEEITAGLVERCKTDEAQ